MSILLKKQHKKKHKYQRANHRNYHRAREIHKKNKKIRASKWKLEFPELFILSNEIPYIVRKNDGMSKL